jgi:hypothetical protein
VCSKDRELLIEDDDLISSLCTIRCQTLDYEKINNKKKTIVLLASHTASVYSFCNLLHGCLSNPHLSKDLNWYSFNWEKSSSARCIVLHYKNGRLVLDANIMISQAKTLISKFGASKDIFTVISHIKPAQGLKKRNRTSSRGHRQQRKSLTRPKSLNNFKRAKHSM